VELLQKGEGPDVIRVETAFSRYPIHRLAKSGDVTIEVRDETEDGLTTAWKVSHNPEYGQPGPLAYKLDTIVINRKVEQAGRDLPEAIRIGSLREIARAVGTNEGNTKAIKDALYQNASTFIKAHIKYKVVGGKGSKSFEFGSTRYAVVFTGSELPDGRIADAVYVVLTPFYRELLKTVEVRPLDYSLLKRLPPAAQRLYELLSFKMFAAIKNGNPTAKLSYADFCTYGPQSRSYDKKESRSDMRERARKQMSKLNATLRSEGYIAGFTMVDAIDRDGRPDWTMEYVPGPKALADHAAFTRSKALPPPPAPVEVKAIELVEVSELVEPEAVAELVARGVTRARAVKLATNFPAQTIAEKIEQWDWLIDRKDKCISRNRPGYLAKSIEDNYATPKGFVSEADRQRHEQDAQESKARQTEARAAKAVEARKEAQIEALVKAELARMTPADFDALVEQLLARGGAEGRAAYDGMPALVKKSYRRMLVEDDIRAKLAHEGP
jgi:hypothetical protein